MTGFKNYLQNSYTATITSIPLKPCIKVNKWEYMVVRPQCMVVKPQHIYGSYTFSWKRANQSHTHY